MNQFVPVVLAACFFSVAAQAQFKPAEAVRVLPPASPVVVSAPGTLEVPVRLEITHGFHINAEKPTLEYLIPTKLEWTSKEFKLLATEYPPAEHYTFSFSPEKPLDVYQGAATIRSRFQVPRGTPPGKVTLRGKLRYQACDDKACYPPVNVPVETQVEVRKRKKN
jgi:hypothetical protein